jgi:hypothetical protein
MLGVLLLLLVVWTLPVLAGYSHPLSRYSPSVQYPKGITGFEWPIVKQMCFFG